MDHPIWFCKREHCDGVLTLLGSEAAHVPLDLTSAKMRGLTKRRQYPATSTHGAPLTCSKCGACAFFVCLFVTCEIYNSPSTRPHRHRRSAEYLRAARGMAKVVPCLCRAFCNERPVPLHTISMNGPHVSLFRYHADNSCLC